ncbi:ATP-grasp domain-containing protein [Streptomyces europaeiscabiei]|uniref:ATP-grasp domain-containing protein n=1 Tax=Streptomyces TaxID=1883 RepID=UPI000A3C479F|nr:MULTISPECIES: ATP-grasp domain-containing protein [Streptomyces]MDX3630109.1 ATP-grasp domain-containing protein [Streptomyces europaeiscabiei]MDX3652362.1 ATP-grasp domain-containing protein [Streptomyces europaeiscabiei]WUD31489.1 ATP-grasp domain-containing protein [Streptomyces europaeiscabiei]
MTGEAFKDACRSLGFAVVSIYTISLDVLAEVAAQHREKDDLSLYARTPDDLPDDFGWPIKAVVPATEPGVFLADTLAGILNLPGNDPARAGARRNKAEMRDLAAAGGVRVPEYEIVRDFAEVPAAAGRIGYPLIIKPSTGAASRDVRLVAEPALLQATVRELSHHDLFGADIDQWLVERYARGRELAVNMFSMDGEHRVIDIWEYRQPGTADYDQPYWDLIQITDEDPDFSNAARFAGEVLECFGVRFGPSHIEIKCTDDGIYLIEIGSRLPGASIAEHWELNSSFRPYEDTLSVLLGDTDAPGKSFVVDGRVAFDALLAICCIRNDAHSGELKAIHGLVQAAEIPGVQVVHSPHQPGDFIPMTRDLNTVVAKLLVSGSARADVLETLRAVRSTISVEIT